MIAYNSDAWWKTVFSFRGTVLPQILGRVGLLTGLCLSLCLINDYVLTRFGNQLPELDPLGHTVLGTALGLLIVFRTNSSFSRYWEARSHWGGIVNCSRNLARSTTAYAGPADDLGRLIVAFAIVLKQRLRDSNDYSAAKCLITSESFDRLSKVSDPPGILALGLSDWIARRLKEDRLSPAMANELEEALAKLVDCQGGCEKIRRTPLPFVYAALIKQILLLYLLTLPFVLVAKMGFAAPLVLAVVALGFLGIEEAGVEFENPFGTAPNGLPLESICEMIANNVTDTTRTS